LFAQAAEAEKFENSGVGTAYPRVAFFADSFYEANGVGTLSRQFEEFAYRRDVPMLSVHAGPAAERSKRGSVETLQLKRSFASFPVDQDTYCDTLLLQHLEQVRCALRAFRAEVVHITGPGDLGVLGARVAIQLGIPLVGSWHTNLHEYAGRRLEKVFGFAPNEMREKIVRIGERESLRMLMRFYKVPRVNLAPNMEAVKLLEEQTKKPCWLMQHGVDTELFHPRQRSAQAGPFNIGYVGRLTPEKNVRMLAAIEQELRARGVNDFRFTMVGDGCERDWLAANVGSCQMTGILRGQDLAKAFADMDAFVFPSMTDTFGLVILEAMASGVPVLVSNGGGPQFQIEPGVDGWVAANVGDYCDALMRLRREPGLRCAMGAKAREHACRTGWDRVFEGVYASYAKVPARGL
jgi:phosphatidylinositol alpha 1,6-mannosyltransferase